MEKKFRDVNAERKSKYTQVVVTYETKEKLAALTKESYRSCLLYTSPSPRDS